MTKLLTYIERWKQIKKTVYYHNFMLFLVFIIISAMFWLMMTLNDNGQHDFEVKLKVVNVPENVTFITDLPQSLHVHVRDRGANLIRTGWLKEPEMQINFNEYAQGGIFRMTGTEINAAIRGVFGSSAHISAMSLDSLRLNYTTVPGKKVNLIIDADVSPSIENIINSQPYSTIGSIVTLYGESGVLDTIENVYTEKIVRHNLKESFETKVKIRPISGVRIEPSEITVVVAVEPLVLKYASVSIVPQNVPSGESLILFPAKAEVSYFAPMSQFEKTTEDIVVVADYNSISTTSDKIGINIESYPEQYVNLKLISDSVEYTIVKKM